MLIVLLYFLKVGEGLFGPFTRHIYLVYIYIHALLSSVLFFLPGGLVFDGCLWTFVFNFVIHIHTYYLIDYKVRTRSHLTHFALYFAAFFNLLMKNLHPRLLFSVCGSLIGDLT